MSISVSLLRRAIIARSELGSMPPRKPATIEAQLDAPADHAEQLPEQQPLGLDPHATGRLVGRDQLFAGPEAAHWPLAAEAPGADADPAQVFHRIAQVGDLPVQHRAQALFADDDIAVAEVGVDQARDRRVGRQARAQGLERQGEHRLGPAGRLVPRVQLLQPSAGGGQAQGRQARRIDRVDGGHRPPALGGQHLARLGEARFAHDPPAQGLALDEAGDEAAPGAVLGGKDVMHHRLGRPRFAGQAHQLRLGLHAHRRLGLARPARRAAQDQRRACAVGVHALEGPGLLARPTREAAEGGDAFSPREDPAHDRADRGLQFRRFAHASFRKAG